MLNPLHDIESILAGARIIHLSQKRVAVGFGGAFVPAKDMSASSIIIGQGVWDRIVGVLISLHQMSEVISACINIFCRFENFVVAEWVNLFGVSPFKSCVFAHLHQPYFTRTTPRFGIKATFLPNDSFNQSGF